MRADPISAAALQPAATLAGRLSLMTQGLPPQFTAIYCASLAGRRGGVYQGCVWNPRNHCLVADPMMASTALRISSPRPISGRTANRIAFAPALNPRDAGQPRKLGASSADALAASSLGVHVHPACLAKRQTAEWRGLSGEGARIVKQEPFEIAYCGPSHLLIVYERAARHKGESLVEGLPRSTLRGFSQKLTFVPAGRTFRESQDPRVPTRVMYLHIDPHGMAADPAAGLDGVGLTPRLFFDSPVRWQTTLESMALLEVGPSTS